MNFVILNGLRKLSNFKFKINQKLLTCARSTEITVAQFLSYCVDAAFHFHMSQFPSACAHCVAVPYQLLSGPPSFSPCNDCALAFYVLVYLLIHFSTLMYSINIHSFTLFSFPPTCYSVFSFHFYFHGTLKLGPPFS